MCKARMYGFTLFRTSLTCTLRHSLVPTDLITLANLALYAGASMTSLAKKGRMAMINRKFFFDHCRQVLFTGRMTSGQVAGLCARNGVP